MQTHFKQYGPRNQSHAVSGARQRIRVLFLPGVFLILILPSFLKEFRRSHNTYHSVGSTYHSVGSSGVFKGVGKRGFGQGVGCSGSGPEGLSKGFEVMNCFFYF